MLLRAVYPYEGPFPGSLKFQADEVFLKIRKENEYWHFVAKNDGSLGCVPENYVEELKDQHSPSIVNFAKNALNSLYNCNVELKDKESIVRTLRSLALENDENTPSNACTTSSESGGTLNKALNKQKGPPASPRKDSKLTHSTPKLKVSLPGCLAAQLVDALRLGTNADYNDCYQSFRVMIELLAFNAPDLRPYVNLLDAMLTESNLDQRHLTYTQSPDWYLLKKYFRSFEQRQGDDQECGWRLHEEEPDTERLLDGLNQLLQKANQDLVQFFLSSNKFQPLLCLIQLYQRETSLTIRRRLLLAIGTCCSLDVSCARVGLSSVLPMELIREIGSVHKGSDVRHMAMCIRLLTMLLAQATELQVDVQTRLNEGFLSHVLGLVGPTEPDIKPTKLIDLDPFNSSPESAKSSSPRKSLLDGRLAHAATTLLLACNWHHCSIAAKHNIGATSNSSHIPLIGALLKHPKASQLFIELVIQAFNRNLDPIFQVSFKSVPNIHRFKRLVRWTDAITSSGTVLTDSGLQLVDESSISAVFDTHNSTEGNESLEAVPSALDTDDGDDDGQYARLLWSENLSNRPKNATDVTLPASVSPTTPRHSVMKCLYDLFSATDSAELVYRNDQDVIVDVITRQLNNLRLPESECVLDYCLLLGLIIAHSDYIQRGAYKGHEVVAALESLLSTEMPETTISPSVRRGLNLARVTLCRLRTALSS